MATEKQLINLEDNLEGLLKKPMHKLEKIRGININHHFERFLFDIGDKGWHSVHKESLL